MDGSHISETINSEESSSNQRKTKLIGVNCSPRLVSALENYIADQPHELTRPEAIRVIVANWLRSQGYI